MLLTAYNVLLECIAQHGDVGCNIESNRILCSHLHHRVRVYDFYNAGRFPTF
jgi:hypothetical protein